MLMNKRQKKKFAKKWFHKTYNYNHISEWVKHYVNTESKRHALILKKRAKFSYPRVYDKGFLIETDKTGNYVEKMYKLKNVCIGVKP